MNEIFITADEVNNTPALPPTVPRPALMGSELVFINTIISRLSRDRPVSTDIVPSTSKSHKHFRLRDRQVSNCSFVLVHQMQGEF